MKIIIVFLLACAVHTARAQGFAINTSGAAANNSAMLDVSSTSKGILIPRVSTAQRAAIASPAKGLMVFDSTLNQFAYYDGAAWLLLATGNSSWTVSGANQYSNVSGNVGVGTPAPADKMHIAGNVRIDGGRLPFVNTGNAVFIGENAGSAGNLTATTGNVAIGTSALESNVSSNGNTAIGYFTLKNNTSNSNTALGYRALTTNTTGARNTALGTSSLENSSTGTDNIAVGVQSIRLNSNGSRNIGIGTFSLYNNSTGTNNVSIGHSSGFWNVSGSGNIFLGYNAGYNETGSDKLYIDNSNTASPLIYGNLAADSLKINGTLTVNNAYTFPGTAGTANQVLQTNGAGQAGWVNASALSVTETDPQVSSSTVGYIPKWNGTSLTDGLLYDNGTGVGLGVASPIEKFHVKGSALIETGRLAFRNTGGGVFVGENAGLNDDMNTNFSTFIGHNAGQNNVSGSSNVAVGARALFTGVSGSYITAIGKGALENAAGAANTALGAEAGRNATGSFNVFIGAGAGMNETGNNKLIIANNATTPLIRGDFAADEVTLSGRLGVGTQTPTQAKLVVVGSASGNLGGYGYLNSSGNTGTSSGSSLYSIYASSRVAASEFNAHSDARIKNIKGISNSQNDLHTLMRIEIADYKLKDSVDKGNKDYKKVIAQQVEQVYPQAVSKMTDVVPDIYKQAEINKGVINLAAALKPGEKVKLIFESGEEIVTVTAAAASSFTVDVNKTGKVFVYGRQVNDFRSVDYEALSTLNISATQELIKRNEQQQKTIEALEARLKALEDKLNPAAVTKQ